MRRTNIAILAIIATVGFGATAQAREAGTAPGASNAQSASAQQDTAKKHRARHLRRAGTTTAGSDSFLPAVGGLVGALGAGGALAASSGDSNPASPE